MTKEWLQPTQFLDLAALEDRFRPGNKERFWVVTQQRITHYRPIALNSVSSGSRSDSTRITDLDPDDEEMMFQVAFGVKEDVRVFLQHPRDYSYGKLPERLPTEGNDVGAVTPDISPYDDPSLEHAGFWIIKDLAEEPRFEAYNPLDYEITPHIALRINKLEISPVSPDSSVFPKLETRQIPSEVVTLKVTPPEGGG